MKKDFYKYGNLVAFITVIVFNILATTGVLGGIKTRDISYMYKSLLAPADFAFSIWSIIYILIGSMVIFQIKNTDSRNQMGNWFFISCILNVLWLITWQYRMIGFSFIIILALLVNLLILMKSLEDTNLLSQLAIGLYAGWINVAMLANLGTLFRRYNWSVFSINSNTLAVIGLVFGILWISYFIFAYSNIFYALSAAWGYMGIIVATNIIGIKVFSIVGMFVFLGCAVLVTVRKNLLT